MNVNFVAQSIPSVNTIITAQKSGSPHQFPREISLRIRTLNLLAQRVIGDSAPLFCKIIYYFDQPKSTLSYDKCESLFEDAFIEEFTVDEIDLFLTSFFKKFDPEEEYISYKNLNEEGQKFLWQGVIRYYCQQYIDFETKYQSLEALFNEIQEKFDPNGLVIKKDICGAESYLEENFEHAMDIIPQFSGDEIIEMKLLLISYCAQLITTLKRVEETKDPNFIIENEYTIKDLFEDIFSLLLELPFLPSIHIESNEALDLHQKMDLLDPQALKEKFLSSLINYILDPQDPDYKKNAEAVREAMSDCYFLDFEYKDFLQNIYRERQDADKI